MALLREETCNLRHPRGFRHLLYLLNLLCNSTVQGGEDTLDALSLEVIFYKRAL